jgi:mycoredoxin
MITMYGTPTCGDCVRARQYFDRNGVDYQEIDVTVHTDKIETVRHYNDGRGNVPVIVFSDGTHLTEPTDADLDAKLFGR